MMKVKCPSCGKEFQIPESAANRPLQCVCKNMFRLNEMKDQSALQLGSIDEALQKKLASSQDLNSYIDSSEEETAASKISDDELDKFLNTLHKSKEETKAKEAAFRSHHDESPRAHLQPPKEIELASPLPEPAPEEQIRLELETSRPAAQEQIHAPFRATTREIVDEESEMTAAGGPLVDRRAFHRSPWDLWRALPLWKKSAASVLTGMSIALIGFGIHWSIKEDAPQETVDPYVQQLLTPAARSRSIPRKEKKTHDTSQDVRTLPAPKETPNPAPHDFYADLVRASLDGRFEDLIRLATKIEAMKPREEVLMFEAQIQRAGDDRARLGEILSKIESRYQQSGDPLYLRAKAWGLVRVSEESRELSYAIEILKSLSLTNNLDPFVFSHLGFAYAKIERVDLATKAWDQSLTLRRDYPWLLLEREKFYRKAGELALATKMAENLTSTALGAEGYIRLAELKALQKDSNGAIAAYRKAIEKNDSAQTRYQLATYLLETKPRLALIEFDQALRKDPERPLKLKILSDLARAHCQLKDYEKAKVAFNRALNESPKDLSLITHKAQCQLQAKQYGAASKTLEEALAIEPKNETLWAIYAQSLLKSNKKKSALAAAQRSLQMKPNTHGFIMAATVLLQMGKKKEAKKYLQQAVQLNPNDKRIKALLADAK